MKWQISGTLDFSAGSFLVPTLPGHSDTGHLSLSMLFSVEAPDPPFSPFVEIRSMKHTLREWSAGSYLPIQGWYYLSTLKEDRFFREGGRMTVWPRLDLICQSWGLKNQNKPKQSQVSSKARSLFELGSRKLTSQTQQHRLRGWLCLWMFILGSIEAGEKKSCIQAATAWSELQNTLGSWTATTKRSGTAFLKDETPKWGGAGWAIAWSNYI